MHNAAFAATGLDWVYVAFPVADDDATSTLRAAWHLGIEGLSVTMPHKQAAARAAGDLDPWVRRMGVANTLVRGTAGWRAHNTDAPGFREWLENDLGVSIAGTRFGLLGAGGVAAAVAAAVSDAAEVAVWNRTPEKAAALVGAGHVLARPEALRAYDVVVSCVPSGAVPDRIEFGDGQIVLDLVYAPTPTDLMRRARGAGARAEDGLGLLLRQGALQFELWTGRVAPLDVMRHALEQARELRSEI
jgi:shikimate dehydrogenase